MTDRDQQPALDVLDRALAALRETPVPEGPPFPFVASTVVALQTSTPAPADVRCNQRRNLMFRIARYSGAALALTALAVLAGSLWLVDRQASPAFAQVLDQVKKAKSVSFVHKQKLGDQTEIEFKMYVQGDGFRADGPGDAVVIADFKQKKGLYLDPVLKVARKIDLAKQKVKNPLDQLRDLKKENAKRIGEEKLEGRQVHVYRIKEAEFINYGGDMKIWVDAETQLPVRITILRAARPPVVGESHYTFEQFSWDKPLDPDLFKLKVPEGFVPEEK